MLVTLGGSRIAPIEMRKARSGDPTLRSAHEKSGSLVSTALCSASLSACVLEKVVQPVDILSSRWVF